MKRNNKKGFTLVELVIVIAVIAILSAILIPTFGNIIDDANRTAAQSDAKAAVTSHMSVVAKTGGSIADGTVIVMLDDKGAAKYYFIMDGGNVGEAIDAKNPTGVTTKHPETTGGSWVNLYTGTEAAGETGNNEEFLMFVPTSASQG